MELQEFLKVVQQELRKEGVRANEQQLRAAEEKWIEGEARRMQKWFKPSEVVVKPGKVYLTVGGVRIPIKR